MGGHAQVFQPMMERDAGKALVFIAGPTAGGKSGLALRIALAEDGVVINADSMQVYRDLSILTARPGAADLEQAPHRLYGVLDGGDACSVARWRGLALAEIEAAWREGRLPILVGGTGLYFTGLEQGIADIPDIPEAIRAEIRERLQSEGAEALYQELALADPLMAARLAPLDRQRVARALEVVLATGRSLALWQQAGNAGGLLHRPDVVIRRHVVAPPRAELYRRCDARLAAMVERGALDEVAALLARGLDPDLPVMKALGVAAFAGYLAGEIGLDAALLLAQRDTRHYAKRQLSWARSRFADWQWREAQ